MIISIAKCSGFDIKQKQDVFGTTLCIIAGIVSHLDYGSVADAVYSFTKTMSGNDFILEYA